MRGNSGFSILPKDTSACRWRRLGSNCRPSGWRTTALPLNTAAGLLCWFTQWYRVCSTNSLLIWRLFFLPLKLNSHRFAVGLFLLPTLMTCYSGCTAVSRYTQMLTWLFLLNLYSLEVLCLGEVWPQGLRLEIDLRDLFSDKRNCFIYKLKACATKYSKHQWQFQWRKKLRLLKLWIFMFRLDWKKRLVWICRLFGQPLLFKEELPYSANRLNWGVTKAEAHDLRCLLFLNSSPEGHGLRQRTKSLNQNKTVWSSLTLATVWVCYILFSKW